MVVGFFRGMATLAWPWWAWIVALIFVNGVLPLLFWETLEAKVVLAAFLLSAAVQMTLFRYLGFVRFLGIGHILVWVPLLAWLWGRLEGIRPEALLAKWLLVLIVVDALSLLIDFIDVARYLRGERDAALTIDDVG